MRTGKLLVKYTSKGKTIRRSLQHPPLWIIDLKGGGFYTINTTVEIMLAMNPPDHLIMEYA